MSSALRRQHNKDPGPNPVHTRWRIFAVSWLVDLHTQRTAASRGSVWKRPQNQILEPRRLRAYLLFAPTYYTTPHFSCLVLHSLPSLIVLLFPSFPVRYLTIQLHARPSVMDACYLLMCRPPRRYLTRHLLTIANATFKRCALPRVLLPITRSHLFSPSLNRCLTLKNGHFRTQVEYVQ